MASLEQQRISDITFLMDSSLNIIEANRNFYRFLNVSTKELNLRFFLDKDSITELIFFLNDYNGKKNTFLTRIYAREQRLECLFIINSCEHGIFYMDLLVVDYLYDLFINSTLLNEEYKTILKNIDTYYWVYDLDNDKCSLKNSKDLQVIFEGDYSTFKKYIIHYFDMESNHIATIKSFLNFENDIQNSYFDKKYKFLLKNKGYITMNTKVFIQKGQKYVIGIFALSDDLNLIKNDYVDKRDGLTGLYNKKTITDMAINRINEAKKDTTLLIIDIDKFKECNDNFGHSFGDEVILTVAKIISESIKGIGYAGRIGGDEFLCILDKIDEDSIRNVTKDIRLGVQWAIPAINPDSVVTCSIGAARYPLNKDNYDDLFNLADKCLYIAKNKGRNCYVIYKPEIHNNVIKLEEEKKTDIVSGKLYKEIADTQLEIITLLQEENRDYYKILELLYSYLKINKITIYDSKFEIIFSYGEDDVDFRSDFLKKKSYFKYFNSYGYFLMDNANILDTLDKEKYDMYLSDNIASSLEIIQKDENNNFKGLICFDKYKPAQTFTEDKVTFALLFSKLL